MTAFGASVLAVSFREFNFEKNEVEFVLPQNAFCIGLQVASKGIHSVVYEERMAWLIYVFAS